MSVIFEGIDEPKYCYTVSGDAVHFCIDYCKFYNMCKYAGKERPDCKPINCPVKQVPKDIEELIVNKEK